MSRRDTSLFYDTKLRSSIFAFDGLSRADFFGELQRKFRKIDITQSLLNHQTKTSHTKIVNTMIVNADVLMLIFQAVVAIQEYEVARVISGCILRMLTRGPVRKNVASTMSADLLSATAYSGSHNVFGRLISGGIVPHDGVLFCAAKRGHHEVVLVLVKTHNTHLDLQTALVLAAACDRGDVVRVLMNHGVFDRRAFAASAWNGHSDIFWWIHRQRVITWIKHYDEVLGLHDDTEFRADTAGFHSSAIEVSVLAGRSNLVRRAMSQFLDGTGIISLQSFGWVWLAVDDIDDIEHYIGETVESSVWEAENVEDADIYGRVSADDFDAIVPESDAKIDEYIGRNGEVGRLLKLLKDSGCSHR
jgi:hypothetical protein